MLSKKEYLTHLDYGVKTCPAIRDAFKKLIEERFELLDRCNELEMTIHSLDCELNDAYNPRYCKFEDLKPNMWIWDNVAKECLYVIKPFVSTVIGAKYFSYLGLYTSLEDIKKLDMQFEENRFSLIKNDRWFRGVIMDEKVIIAWNCIKSLKHYPIMCSKDEEQDEFESVPFDKLFKEQIEIIDNYINSINKDKEAKNID